MKRVVIILLVLALVSSCAIGVNGPVGYMGAEIKEYHNGILEVSETQQE